MNFTAAFVAPTMRHILRLRVTLVILLSVAYFLNERCLTSSFIDVDVGVFALELQLKLKSRK